ncbi:MAG: hemolysin family protein, partial [Alphaproteobacteria bacterium]
MGETVLNILVVLLLLGANAFYVAAEFALVKARGYRVETLARDRRFGARLVQRMLGKIEAYLACCQLGITMASLGLGWVGEPTVSSLLDPLLSPLGMPGRALHFVSFLAGFLLFSSLHIVVGEQVPKTLAIREPEPVSLWIAYPLHASFIAFFPLNWLLNSASRAVLRLFRIREVAHAEVLSGPELEGLVDASAEHGTIREGQAQYIRNVFRLGELEVSEVMLHRKAMEAIDADLPAADIVAAVLKSKHTRLPLYRDNVDNIIGVLHAKDLLRAMAHAGGNLDRLDLKSLARKPWFVPETRPAREQLNAFLRRRNHFALVVDEYGALMGLVTLEDILEEIVGEIDDEYDVKSAGIRPQPDGSIHVDGSVAIRDLNRTME